VLAALVLLAAGCVAILSSDWFAGQVRRALIQRTERASGGRAELDSFQFDWPSMRVTVRGFTLHGRELRQQAPLFTAPEITLDLQVLSFFRRDVVLRRLQVSRPSIHVYVDADGKTNLPSPERPDPKSNPVASLLKLRIRRIDIADGVFEYDRRSVPFHLIADKFIAELDYKTKGPAYAVNLSTSHLRLNRFDGIGFTSRLTLEPGGLQIEEAVIRRLGAEARVTGEMAGFKRPELKVRVQLAQPLAEVGIPGLRSGLARWDAVAVWNAAGYSVQGPLTASGVEWRSPGFRMEGGTLAAGVVLTNGVVTLEKLLAHGLGGSWSGRGELTGWSHLKLDGVASSISLAAIVNAIPGLELPWSGLISGPSSFEGDLGAWGVTRAFAGARLEIQAAAGELPAEGVVNITWRQDGEQITFDDSAIRLPGTEMRVSGALGRTLHAALFTTDLREVESATALFFKDRLPLTQYLALNGGSARLDAVIDGPLAAPVISGRVELTRFGTSGVDLDSGTATFRLDSSRLDVRRFEILHAGARSTGQVSLPLDHWRLNSAAPMRASLNLRNVGASDLGRLARITTPLGGRVTAAATIGGTPDVPVGTIDLEWREARIGPERVRLLSAGLQTRVGPSAELSGRLNVDGDPVDVSAVYNHQPGSWRHGRLRVHFSAQQLKLARFESVSALRPGLGGNLESSVVSELSVSDGSVALRALDGFARLELASGNRTLGAARIDASTVKEVVQLRVQGTLQNHEFGGESRVRLAPGYACDGRIALPRMPLRDLQAVLEDKITEPWPVQGFLGGDITLKGELAKPRSLKARIALTRLQIAPGGGGILESEVDKNDLVIRNAGPIAIDVDADAAYLRSARLRAKDTSLTVAGLYSFASRSPLDLSLNGTANLEVLSTFEPDLLASGTARISANVRGELPRPYINGQMRISGASFFLRDLPNGIDGATGTIHFDRDRAQIDNLTGKSGGGNFKINGFVGFSAREWTYRLSAEAGSIRVRYPEGVSTTADASLTLTGSSTRSLLSGLVTVRRSGFNMKQDLGSIITGSANPIPVPATQNAFLRNLQFDVRVRTSPNATFQTSYTRDLETRADLRLRGSPAKPVILGSVEVNQGQVQFFGNQYTISRGELLFFNTAAIQPSINLDLETRIRGVTVYLNVSGPLSRLDVNYRSEPPLQSEEILALLTVGRAPTATSSTIPASISSRSSVLGESNANTLLGGALSASVSSRVQKFFGASRIKIDPNVTGVENLPQARLTIEQSLSRNIVFTYSINLSRSSQQVVRMEWDLSDDWSLIAVRDENGAFGVDFLFRHRFK